MRLMILGDWFKVVVPLLDPETDSLLVLYDDAQSIYKKNKTLDFTFPVWVSKPESYHSIAH